MTQAVRGVAVAVACLFAIHIFWPAPFAIVIEGAILGSLLGLSAFGMGLVYRANRVVNFAQADLGVIPATVFVTLVTTKYWTYWRALAASLACALVLGFLVERVVIRWFSRAPRLMVTVATLGLAQLLAGAGSAVPQYLRFVKPDYSYLPPSPEGNAAYAPPFHIVRKIGPMIFNGGDVMALLSVTVVAAALFVFLRYTTTGLALRGAAESEERAALLGIPVGRIHSLVWAMATGLSALSLILRGGIFGLPEQSLLGPAFLLRTLAAAVIGRMENFVSMFAASVGIGVLELSIFWNQRGATLIEPLLCVVIIGTLVFQHWRTDRRRDRASTWRQGPTFRPVPRELRHLAIVRHLPIVGYASVAVALLVLPVALDAGQLFLATTIVLLGIGGISVVILTGWAGEISLGQMAFAAVGTVTAVILNINHRVEPVTTIMVAALIGAAAGALVGVAGLRVRGLFLAVMTLAVGVAASTYLLNANFFPSLFYLKVFVKRVPALGVLPIEDDRAFYYFCLVVLAVALFWARGLQRGRTGRVLIAIRENGRAARAFGVGVDGSRLMAFALGGYFAAIAGALLAIQQKVIPQELLAPQESIRTLTGVVVGGLSSLPGAFVGTVFLKATQWFSRVVPREYRSQFTSAGTGGGLLLVLMLMPGGLASVAARARDAYFRFVAKRHDIHVPSLVGDNRSAVHKRRRVNPALALRGQLPLRFVELVSAFSAEEAEPGLQVRSLHAGYGPVQVLFGVDVAVAPGQMVCLLGTNGAGKSTILKAVSGLVPSSGEARLDGVNLALLSPQQIARLGVMHVPSSDAVFGSLTVAQNMRLAGWLHRWHPAEDGDRMARAVELFPELESRWSERAGNLSGGQQQMLKLAMGFVAAPRVLLIDELSLGLAPSVVERLLVAVRAIRDSGVAVVLVEQSVNVALEAADTAYFLEKGEVRYVGPTGGLLDRPDILRSVFLQNGNGKAARRKRTPAVPVSATPVLEARGVHKSFGAVRALDDLSLCLHEGEIAGIIGPNGSGKTTLLDILSGFVDPDGGSVWLGGRDVTGLGPEQRALGGLGRSFQDAALFGALTVEQTIMVAADRHLPVKHPVADAFRRRTVVAGERSVGERASEIIALLHIEDFRDKFVAELSTGSRRVVDLACQLAFDSKVILLDEPSAGIAQRETEALAPLLLRIRAETGASLLIVDHDMELVRAVADRVVALHLGRTIAEGSPAKVLGADAVQACYLGGSPVDYLMNGPVRRATR